MTSNWFLDQTRQRNNAELKRGRSIIENSHGEDINRYGYAQEDHRSMPIHKRAKTSRNPSGIRPNNNNDVHNSYPVHIGQGYCSNVSNNFGWNLLRVPIGAPGHVSSVSSQSPIYPNKRLPDHRFSNSISPLTIQKPMISKEIQNQFDDLPEWQPDNPRLRNSSGSVQHMLSMNPSNSIWLHGGQANSFRNMNHGNFINHDALSYPQVGTNMAPSQKLPDNNLQFGIGFLMADSMNSLPERILNTNQQPVPVSFSESIVTDFTQIQESKQPIESTSELEFDAAKLKVRNESAIAALYGDLPRQCTSCGMRFKCQAQHSKHMDWHLQKNRMKSNMSQKQKHLQKLKQSRKWFANAGLWLSAATGETIDEKTVAQLFNVKNDAESRDTNEEHIVPADESQTNCALCNEPFEDFFSDEADEWMYKEAVYLNMKKGTKLETTRSMDRSLLGPIVHFKCMPETKNSAAKDLKQHMVPLGLPSSDLRVC